MSNCKDNKGVVRIPQWKDCSIDKTKNIPQHGISEPSFSKLGYDTCAYKTDIKESKAPGLYKLNDRTHYDSCYMQFPGYLAHDENSGILDSAVDAESELRRLNYKNSKCPSERYTPLKNCKECKSCYSGIPCDCLHCKKDPHNFTKVDCVQQLIPEFTRERKPCNDITSININRFEPLCLDLQKKAKIQSNQYIGQQTRYDMKDLTRRTRKTTLEEGSLPESSKNKCICKKISGAHLPLECLYEPRKL